jgi:hypothetical protein
MEGDRQRRLALWPSASLPTLCLALTSTPFERLPAPWTIFQWLYIPMALAENAGLSPIEEVAAAKAKQLRDGNPTIGQGVDREANTDGTHICDMRELGVFETLIGKKEQLLLAVQVTKMILKIDDVISPSAHFG